MQRSTLLFALATLALLGVGLYLTFVLNLVIVGGGLLFITVLNLVLVVVLVRKDTLARRASRTDQTSTLKGRQA